MPEVILFTNLVPELAQQIIGPAPSDWNASVHAHDLPEAEKARLAADADFLILFPSTLEETVLRSAQRLKLVQLVSAGFEHMPLDLLAELAIPLANNGGTNAIDVAEHTFALILSVYRRLTEMDRNVRNEGWKAIDSGMTTFTIHGKTVGIVGLGHIGKEVAKRLVPFQANVLYFDPFPVPAEEERLLQVERVSLEELLQRSDIVTLHVPLNDQTRTSYRSSGIGAHEVQRDPRQYLPRPSSGRGRTHRSPERRQHSRRRAGCSPRRADQPGQPDPTA